MKTKEQTRKLAAGYSKHSFEVVDKTDEVSSKRRFEVADRTDEVCSKRRFGLWIELTKSVTILIQDDADVV
ncbi:chlorohydrolase [Streptococcus pneumoniae]|nr:chlorohydrolase [Streptococcus pneumoniae]